MVDKGIRLRRLMKRKSVIHTRYAALTYFLPRFKARQGRHQHNSDAPKPGVGGVSLRSHRRGLLRAKADATLRAYSTRNSTLADHMLRATSKLFNCMELWWAQQDSNLRLPPCEGGTLPLSYAPGKSFIINNLRRL
jgi:hypothetical protein